VTQASYAVLAACTISHFMNHVFTGALSPFLQLIQSELGISYTLIGVIASAAIVSMTTAHLLVGYLGDRGFRDAFISISVIGAAIATLLTSFAQDFVFLAIFQVFLGIGASGYHPSSFPALTEKFPNSHRAKATGIQAMGGLVGMAITPFLGVSLLLLVGSWQVSLRVIAILGFVLFIPTLWLMRQSTAKPKDESPFEEDTEGPEGWTRNFWLMIVLMGLRGMAFRCTSLLMPLYLVVTYSASTVSAGVLTAIMLTAGLVGEVVSSVLSDRLHNRVGFLVMSTGLATPALLLLNFALAPLSLILVLIIIGFFFYLGVPANTALQTEVSPRRSRGLAFGLLFSVGSIPGAVSPIIFGFIGDLYGLPASILFLVITTFLATIVALFLKEDRSIRSAVHLSMPGEAIHHQ
jgi:FSR family fosmidomycin resistance protein-like MFS transporter